ncbi:hypothetical protein [uncultured Cohaesibacter sp.]|uniref:hypothetical protein n=1 Tax=uncultured Cohaesibacter sp. TaxID=1002546 RepID=UPI00292CC00A|nr:hypothetical protein [uncultured Cohaesibacter sp.]
MLRSIFLIFAAIAMVQPAYAADTIPSKFVQHSGSLAAIAAAVHNLECSELLIFEEVSDPYPGFKEEKGEADTYLSITCHDEDGSGGVGIGYHEVEGYVSPSYFYEFP